MKLHAVRASAVLALLLAGSGVVQAQMRDYRAANLDLLQLLGDKPWPINGPQHRWDRRPSFHFDLDNPTRDIPMDDEEEKIYPDDEDFRFGSEKRSGLATALNYGRRRREPTQTLGKVITPNRGGLLNNVGSFFDALRGNLQNIAYVPPQRVAFQDTSDVDEPTSTGGGGGGGGSGIRNIHTLRPLRPVNNIRSYNRRSFVKADGGYPGANHHNPELLWTELGR